MSKRQDDTAGQADLFPKDAHAPLSLGKQANETSPKADKPSNGKKEKQRTAKKQKKKCSECGASMMEHRHTLSQALAVGLYRLYLQDGKVNIKSLNLSRNQWDNFQKLRYWGLVRKSHDAAGSRIGGTWEITDLGVQFIEDTNQSMPRAVWTYRGETIRAEEDRVHFRDVHGPYRKRADYAEDSVPHDPDGLSCSNGANRKRTPSFPCPA